MGVGRSVVKVPGKLEVYVREVRGAYLKELENHDCFQNTGRTERFTLGLDVNQGGFISPGQFI